MMNDWIESKFFDPEAWISEALPDMFVQWHQSK